MAKLKNKFYVVKVGHKTGIFASWAECEAQVKGYPGAIYKGFPTEKEAVDYLGESKPTINTSKTTQSCPASPDDPTEQIELTKKLSCEPGTIVAYTDGSYKEKINTYSYGLVVIQGMEVIHQEGGKGTHPEATQMRNVAGELQGAMKAMQYAVRAGVNRLVIFHDYQGVACWVTGEWKAKNAMTQAYRNFMKRMGELVKMEFVWVRGHNKNEYNEMADRLASEAMKG